MHGACRGQKRLLDTQNWIYRCLSISMWVLGTYLQEQLVLLTVEPSLQPRNADVFISSFSGAQML